MYETLQVYLFHVKSCHIYETLSSAMIRDVNSFITTARTYISSQQLMKEPRTLALFEHQAGVGIKKLLWRIYSHV